MSTISGYTKLFQSILASTVWNEPNEVRIVWITMLAMADRFGVVDGSVPGLALFARVSVDATRKALDALSAPDQDSRTKDHEGRRIEAVDGGWRLINHGKYRAKMGADERREYLKLKAREYRRQKSTNVADRRQSRHIAEAEATPKAGKSTHRRHTFCGIKFCVPMFLHEGFTNQLGEQGLAKFDLLEWYPTLDERYEAIPIGGDVLGWVRKEFQEATKSLFGDPAQVRRNRMGVR